jgi:hypothetical protein
MNGIEAFAKLDSFDRSDLYDWCYEGHKDFYGVKGRHMNEWSRSELIAWIKAHYLWDCDAQGWRNAVPFCED